MQIMPRKKAKEIPRAGGKHLKLKIKAVLSPAEESIFDFHSNHSNNELEESISSTFPPLVAKSGKNTSVTLRNRKKISIKDDNGCAEIIGNKRKCNFQEERVLKPLGRNKYTATKTNRNAKSEFVSVKSLIKPCVDSSTITSSEVTNDKDEEIVDTLLTLGDLVIENKCGNMDSETKKEKEINLNEAENDVEMEWEAEKENQFEGTKEISNINQVSHENAISIPSIYSCPFSITESHNKDSEPIENGVASSNEKQCNEEGSEERASIDKESNNVNITCPVCNDILPDELNVRQKEIHINNCLDNTTSSSCSLIDELLATRLQSEVWQKELSKDPVYICSFCKKDMSLWNFLRRETHVKKCSSKEVLIGKEKEKKGTKKRKKTEADMKKSTSDNKKKCPLCSKLQDDKKFTSHLKQCATKQKLPMSKVLCLLRDGGGNSSGAEISSESTAVNSRAGFTSIAKKRIEDIQLQIYSDEEKRKVLERVKQLAYNKQNPDVGCANVFGESRIGKGVCKDIRDVVEGPVDPPSSLSNENWKHSKDFIKNTGSRLWDFSSAKPALDITSYYLKSLHPDICVFENPELCSNISIIGGNEDDEKGALSASFTATQCEKLNILLDLNSSKENNELISQHGFICDESEENLDELKRKSIGNLIEDMDFLLQSSLHSDFLFHCKDNVDLPAHSLILSTRIKEFTKICDGKKEMDFRDISAVAVGVVLKFLYTGSMPSCQEEIDGDVFQLALRFNLDLLKDFCLLHKHDLLESNDNLSQEYNADELVRTFWENGNDNSENDSSMQIDSNLNDKEDVGNDSCFSDDEINLMQEIFHTQARENFHVPNMDAAETGDCGSKSRNSQEAGCFDDDLSHQRNQSLNETEDESMLSVNNGETEVSRGNKSEEEIEENRCSGDKQESNENRLGVAEGKNDRNVNMNDKEAEGNGSDVSDVEYVENEYLLNEEEVEENLCISNKSRTPGDNCSKSQSSLCESNKDKLNKSDISAFEEKELDKEKSQVNEVLAYDSASGSSCDASYSLDFTPGQESRFKQPKNLSYLSATERLSSNDSSKCESSNPAHTPIGIQNNSSIFEDDSTPVMNFPTHTPHSSSFLTPNLFNLQEKSGQSSIEDNSYCGTAADSRKNITPQVIESSNITAINTQHIDTDNNSIDFHIYHKKETASRKVDSIYANVITENSTCYEESSVTFVESPCIAQRKNLTTGNLKAENYCISLSDRFSVSSDECRKFSSVKYPLIISSSADDYRKNNLRNTCSTIVCETSEDETLSCGESRSSLARYIRDRRKGVKIKNRSLQVANVINSSSDENLSESEFHSVIMHPLEKSGKSKPGSLKRPAFHGDKWLSASKTTSSTSSSAPPIGRGVKRKCVRKKKKQDFKTLVKGASNLPDSVASSSEDSVNNSDEECEKKSKLCESGEEMKKDNVDGSLLRDKSCCENTCSPVVQIDEVVDGNSFYNNNDAFVDSVKKSFTGSCSTPVKIVGMNFDENQEKIFNGSRETDAGESLVDNVIDNPDVRNESVMDECMYYMDDGGYNSFAMDLDTAVAENGDSNNVGNDNCDSADGYILDRNKSHDSNDNNFAGKNIIYTQCDTITSVSDNLEPMVTSEKRGNDLSADQKEKICNAEEVLPISDSASKKGNSPKSSTEIAETTYLNVSEIKDHCFKYITPSKNNSKKLIIPIPGDQELIMESMWSSDVDRILLDYKTPDANSSAIQVFNSHIDGTTKDDICSKKASKVFPSHCTKMPIHQYSPGRTPKSSCHRISMEEAYKKFGPGCSLHPETNEPITPMPDYSSFPTPELKVEIKKYALRGLPKHKMVAKMKEIYKYQHNFTQWEEEVTPKPKRKIKGKEKNAKTKSAESETSAENSSQLSQKGKKGGASRKPKISSNSDCTDSPTLNEKLLTFITENPPLHYKVLTYQPLEFISLYQTLKSSEIKVSKRELEIFLDNQCICFYTAKDDAKKPKRRRAKR